MIYIYGSGSSDWNFDRGPDTVHILSRDVTGIQIQIASIWIWLVDRHPDQDTGKYRFVK